MFFFFFSFRNGGHVGGFASGCYLSFCVRVGVLHLWVWTAGSRTDWIWEIVIIVPDGIWAGVCLPRSPFLNCCRQRYPSYSIFVNLNS